MNQEWQAKRRNLNHKWLNNDFLRLPSAFISRVEDGAHDVDRLKEFTEPHWQPVAELLNLLKDGDTPGPEAGVVTRTYIELAANIGG